MPSKYPSMMHVTNFLLAPSSATEKVNEKGASGALGASWKSHVFQWLSDCTLNSASFGQMRPLI